MASDYVYLQIPTRARRGQLDSKTLHGYFANDLKPRAIVLPFGTNRFEFADHPSSVINGFRAMIAKGVNVKALSERQHTILDSTASGNRILEPKKASPNAPMKVEARVYTLAWSGVCFLVSKDDFVTFFPAGNGYIACTKDKACFIERKREHDGADQPATAEKEKPSNTKKSTKEPKPRRQ